MHHATVSHCCSPTGADGIRSRVRPFVTESQDSPVPTGESAYRLLVNVEDLKARAPKHSWIGRDGLLKPDMFFVHTGDRRAIAYPCKGRKALNFGAYIGECSPVQQTNALQKNLILITIADSGCAYARGSTQFVDAP
jgi:hypothetical protein